MEKMLLKHVTFGPLGTRTVTTEVTYRADADINNCGNLLTDVYNVLGQTIEGECGEWDSVYYGASRPSRKERLDNLESIERTNTHLFYM